MHKGSLLLKNPETGAEERCNTNVKFDFSKCYDFFFNALTMRKHRLFFGNDFSYSFFSLASFHLSTILSSIGHSSNHLLSICCRKRDSSSIVVESES